MRCESCGHLNPDEVLLCGRCHALLGSAHGEVDAWLGPGDVILARYRVDAPIGEGAMGQVFRATDTLSNRTVALKLLHPSLSIDAKARMRMQREAVALGRIRHRNVVAIHNVFEYERVIGLELEFVHGGSLADLLAKAPLPVPHALGLTHGVLAGLAAVHEAGVLHRDVKPPNILLTPEGVPKLADFGIARDQTARTLTGAGTHLGTPGYMSPEQFTEGKVSPATDIYAVGVLLYEMLTCALPFDGRTDFDIFQAQLNQPPDLARLAAVAPQSIVDVVGRALAIDPAQRWPTAAALAAALPHPPRAAPAGEANGVELGWTESAELHGPREARERRRRSDPGPAPEPEPRSAPGSRSVHPLLVLLVVATSILGLGLFALVPVGWFLIARASAVAPSTATPESSAVPDAGVAPTELTPKAVESVATPAIRTVHVTLAPGANAGPARVVLVRGDDRRELPELPVTLELPVNESYQLIATRDGYEDYVQRVTFESNETEKQYVVALRRTATGAVADAGSMTTSPPAGAGYGWLNANSIPASQVIVDGRPLGLTPVRIRVPVGAHTVVFVHPEKGRQARTVRVTSDRDAVAVTRF